MRTLAAAAYSILHTLARKRGVSDLLFDSRIIKPEFRKSG